MPAPKDPIKYEEWRRKLRAAKKGWIPWNKGRKFSEESEYDETRRKMSESHKGVPRPELRGRPLSKEHRAKLSVIRKGRRIGFAKGGRHSEETRRKMSKSHVGLSNGSPSEEVRQQISDSLREYYTQPGSRTHLVGREVSDEQRRKQSKSMARFYETGEGIDMRRRLGKILTERQTGKPLSEEHRQAISAGVSQAVIDGKLNIKSRKFKTGHHFSPKTNSKHYYRSSYELRAYQILDADPNVATYIAEPMVIHYTYKSKSKRYIPDLYVEYRDGSWAILEVKPEYQLNWLSVQTKINAAINQLPTGCFEVWCEKELTNE